MSLTWGQGDHHAWSDREMFVVLTMTGAAAPDSGRNQDARRGCPREVIRTRALAARTASESVLMS